MSIALLLFLAIVCAADAIKYVKFNSYSRLDCIGEKRTWRKAYIGACERYSQYEWMKLNAGPMNTVEFVYYADPRCQIMENVTTLDAFTCDECVTYLTVNIRPECNGASSIVRGEFILLPMLLVSFLLLL